jgi:hypothetical protein
MKRSRKKKILASLRREETGEREGKIKSKRNSTINDFVSQQLSDLYTQFNSFAPRFVGGRSECKEDGFFLAEHTKIGRLDKRKLHCTLADELFAFLFPSS